MLHPLRILSVVVGLIVVGVCRCGASAAAAEPPQVEEPHEPSLQQAQQAESVQQAQFQQVSRLTCARCGCRGPKCCCRTPCYVSPTTPEPQPSTVAPPTQTRPSEMLPSDAPPSGSSLDAGAAGRTTPNLNAFAGNYGAARGFDSVGPNMFGDFSVGSSFGSNGNIAVSTTITTTTSFYSIPIASSTTTATSNYGNGRAAVPFVTHTFKAAENESPWARTRLIYHTNYYGDIGDATNITRQMFGFELAGAEGRASVGVRAPLYTVDPGVQSSPYFSGGSIGTFGTETGNSTAFGDLITNFKYSLIYDPAGGNVLSVGTIVTANTGPSTFGGVTPFFNVDGIEHVATIQPYAAFYRSFSRPGTSGAFVQGFFSSDTPFNSNDSTLLFTDLAVGYIFRTAATRGRNGYSRSGWITAIVPTFEIHSNNFLNKRDYGVSAGPGFAQAVPPGGTTTSGDPGGPGGGTTTTVGAATIAGTVRYHDQFNLTTGVTMVMNGRSTLALGVVTPVAGPNPYDYELQLTFNRYLGSSLAPPPYRR